MQFCARILASPVDQIDVLEFMLEDLAKIRQTRGKGIDLGPQHPCPKCKSPLIRRKGKNGIFWGCSRYPDCNGLMQDNGGKPQIKASAEASNIDCPSCQSGKLIRRKAKKKGYWWGCTLYPKCKAVYWDKKGTPNLKTPQKETME